MPLQATSGAASYDAFGGGVAAVPTYIEDIFGTFLYTGNSSTQTITNGIDLAGKGGLVWAKARSSADNHGLYDTARGVENRLISNSTAAESTASGVTAFNANGFSLGSNSDVNGSGKTTVSWTFRKQPKFFDVVTWTGNAANRTIAHNLGSVPGCIIVKRTDSTGFWSVYHRGLGDTPGLNPEKFVLYLQTTNAQDGYVDYWNMTLPTSTQFSIGANSVVNASGGTYVAYLFAHNAGGFGLTGTDNVISCGSYTTDGSADAVVTLGYEPQWLLIKCSDAASNWVVLDNMRGIAAGVGGGTANDAMLFPNANYAESVQAAIELTATGFHVKSNANIANGAQTYIYIAIRRGPMKVPTSGTSVFSPVLTTTNNTITTNFPVDLSIFRANKGVVNANQVFDRLRGATQRILTTSTDAETTTTANILFDNNTGTALTGFTAGLSGVDWAFRRAPSFFDEVCYTGNNNGTGQTLSHNLAAVPELMIVKRRGNVGAWLVYSAATGATNYLMLQDTAASAASSTVWQNTAPTATQFTIGQTPNQADTYVAYLFATCAGVSKCGTFTGNGSSQTINCGFTGGARFVMIKATSTTGDWMVADSARGIVSGNDPYLELNNTNAEVTGEDWLDTDSTGFVVNEVSGSNANTNGVTYIYLAIA